MDIDVSLVNQNLLPPQVRQLARVIGLAETFKLLQARGGHWLQIPHRSDRVVVLRNILSKESIEKLVKTFPGVRLDLPKCDKIILQLRNKAIREMRKTKTDREIANAFNLSRRHVINISQENTENPNLELFPLDN